MLDEFKELAKAKGFLEHEKRKNVYTKPYELEVQVIDGAMQAETEDDKLSGVMYMMIDGGQEFDRNKFGPELLSYSIEVESRIVQAKAKAPASTPAQTSGPSAKKEPAASVPAAKSKAESTAMVPAQESKPAVVKSFMEQAQINGKGVPEELAVKLGGKLYAEKNLRWQIFHSLGLKMRECVVEMIHWSFKKGEDDPMSGVAIAKVTMTIDDGFGEPQKFQAIGVASKENTNQKIHVHLDHMAETRAKNRALGDIIAGGWRIPVGSSQIPIPVTGGCSAEELPDFDGDMSGD